jgi:predicted HTH domain antitoxin
MSILIPDDVIYATHMNASEFMQEIAIHFFELDRLTLGQASRLAGMSQLQFQFLLFSRQISVHYDVAEFEADLQTLR